MKIKNYSLSAIRNSEKFSQGDFEPSMVDTTLHNPTLGEILERYTKTGQLMCNQRQAIDEPESLEDIYLPEDLTDIEIGVNRSSGSPEEPKNNNDVETTPNNGEGGEGGHDADDAD